MNLALFEQRELKPEAPGRYSGALDLRDPRAVHLLKVLHKKAGSIFDAGALDGKLGTGRIEAVNEKAVLFSFAPESDPPPRTPLCLALGFPRPIQLRRLLRDCASLGLLALDLVATELGEKSYRDTKLLEPLPGGGSGGAYTAMVEGAVQARDTRLPRLAVYPDGLAAWLKRRPWEAGLPPGSAAAPLLAAADNVRPTGTFSVLKPPPQTARPFRAVLAVGSERGWSERERELLEEAGFLRLSLGPRALRTETACVAASVLLMEKMGLLD